MGQMRNAGINELTSLWDLDLIQFFWGNLWLFLYVWLFSPPPHTHTPLQGSMGELGVCVCLPENKEVRVARRQPPFFSPTTPTHASLPSSSSILISQWIVS